MQEREAPSVGSCCGPKVCVPGSPKYMDCNLIPNVMVFGGEAFGG